MKTKTMTPYQVSVAAEAFAACVLAHGGCEVGIQYGANQPGHDLVATRGHNALKISVKGSQDGGWGLIMSHKKPGVSYAEAADLWCRVQPTNVIFCLVQFEGVQLGGAPRCYFASPEEIAKRLRESRGGRGSTILYEDYTIKKGEAAGVTDKLPDSWKVSAKRIDELFQRHLPSA